MLPEVDALPGPEAQPALLDRHAQMDRRQGRSHMRRHVIVAFDRMDKQWITIGNQAREEGFEVAPHIRVGVLLNHERRGCVLEQQCAETGLDSRS